MKRFELITGGVVVGLIAAAMIAFNTIPRPRPAQRAAGPASGSSGPASSDPTQDPARQLWKSDPARTVYVFGEAERPGAHAIPVGAEWTIRDLITAVGGIKASALGRLRVMRKVDGAITQVLELDRGQVDTATDPIQPGDVVYVD